MKIDYIKHISLNGGFRQSSHNYIPASHTTKMFKMSFFMSQLYHHAFLTSYLASMLNLFMQIYFYKRGLPMV